MNTAKLQRAAVLLLLLAVSAACSKTSGDAASLRHQDPYSALVYADDNTVHVLATGELQYNP